MSVQDKPEQPPSVKPRIIAAPKIRQICWCDFWNDSRLPEMWKTRPVVVVSFKNPLHGPCTAVPIRPNTKTKTSGTPAFNSDRRGAVLGRL